MSTIRRSAVSYSRFSDAKQAAGDSSDRQERDYKLFCERHNLTPGKEVFADRGRSGYHDEHRTRGRLGKLIEAAKAGRFESGTVVVIEAWDRLGRLRPDRQTELVAELLRTGVCIGICRLDDIFTEEDFGTHKWTTLAVFIQLAYQESKQKADRVAASWAQRREKAREDGTSMGASLPAWVKRVNEKFVLIPDRAETIRHVFKLAADGLGHTKIVKALVKEKVPAFGQRVVREGRTRSQFSGGWSKPYVALILRDRRVLGEVQPLKAGNPDGKVLIGYYPPVITEEEFALARATQESRTSRDRMGRQIGPRHVKYVNVFKSLLTHARDGEGFLLHNKGTRAKPELILINHVANGGRAEKGYTFPYPVFEEAVLKLLRELDAATVLTQDIVPPALLNVLRAKLANHREDIASIKKDLTGGYSRGLADVLRATEAAELVVANDLQDELARVAKPLTRSWEELPSLIDLVRGAEDPEAARLKLRPALRAIVETAAVLIVPRGSWRLVLVQFRFNAGGCRNWLIAHQTAAFRRVGGWVAHSFTDDGVASDFDLRRSKDMRAVEKVLTALDPAVLMMTAPTADPNKKPKTLPKPTRKVGAK